MIRLTYVNQQFFLFIILATLLCSSIFSQINEEINNNKAQSNKKFEDIKAATDKKQKELYERIENSNTNDITKDNLDILSIKDEITRKQFLALLNIIKETASPEVYQQQKKALQKAIQEHEKLSLLLKEENNLNVNKNDSSLSEERFFIPQEPIELSSDAKKIDCTERIKNKFIGEIPQQVRRIIYHLDNYQAQIKENLPVPNLILLHGKPGTGKTILVKAIAEELEVALMYVPAGALTDKFHGESQRRVGRFFENAKMYVRKHNKPIILFIDEVDAIAVTREGNVQPEYRQLLSRLLTELQDVRNNKGIIAFVATNTLGNLDRAIKDRFGDAICEIKDIDMWQGAIFIRNIFKEHGKDIDKYCAETLAAKLGEISWGEIPNRTIRDIIEAGIVDKERDCKMHPENCNLHEFYYIWKELERREWLIMAFLNAIAPCDPIRHIFLGFEKIYNFVAESDAQSHVVKDSIYGCSQCFYNKTKNNTSSNTNK